jgi:hypothetical protein
LANLDAKTFVAVGPNGADISRDGGAHWTHSGTLNLNAIATLDAQNVWAAGPNGTVARLEFHQQ